MMPEMNGRMLADELEQKCPDFPVLYISGYTDDNFPRQGAHSSNIAA